MELEIEQDSETDQFSAGVRSLSVAAIENGTVIDHIAEGKAILLVRLLKLENHRKPVTLGLNLPSASRGKKDLIKVEGKELSGDEISQIAIFSPNTTLNIIQNYKVIKKVLVEATTDISHVIICPNLQCISNHERTSRRFHVVNDRKEIQLQCHYCEKIFLSHEITQYDL